MRATLKTHFIPHEGNNYHPHILHTKRAVLYGCVGIVSKAIVVLFITAVPLSAFMAPDVLTVQANNIVTLTNTLRERTGLFPYKPASPLERSSENKADDMADRQYFSHRSPDGKTITSWIDEQGYDYAVAGENLAMGFHTAEDVVAAWTKSTTHYANLIDRDFQDVGVGVVSGTYDGIPTIYVAQHFGAPQVLSVPQKKSKSPVVLKREPSHVDWKKADRGTVLSATAALEGPVKTVEVHVRDHAIPLQRETADQYTGEVMIPEEPAEIFQAVVPPALTIIDEQGTIVRDTIDWTRVAPSQPSTVEKYRFARSVGSAISDVFDVSRWIYLGFILLFGIALILNIVIEFRKQHPHVIAQTLGLITLFVFLFRI